LKKTPVLSKPVGSRGPGIKRIIGQFREKQAFAGEEDWGTAAPDRIRFSIKGLKKRY
jgi:hypothetical protein